MHFLVNLRRALDRYYVFLREQKRSESTIYLYRHILEKMADALGPKTWLRTITPEDVDRAVEAMFEPTHSVATKEKYKRAVRTFFKWLVRYRYLSESPAVFTVTEFIPPPIDLSNVISKEEIERMMEACDELRDRALVMLFRDTAMRFSAAWNLRLEHIDREKGSIFVPDVKVAPYKVFPPESTFDALEAWLGEREKLVAALPEDHGYVFVRLDTGEWMAYWGLFSVMRRLGHRAKVKRFSPHKFRHAWGKWAAENKIATTVAQAQLGHKSSRTTRDFYYKTAPDTLRDAAQDRVKEFEDEKEDSKIEDGGADDEDTGDDDEDAGDDDEAVKDADAA